MLLDAALASLPWLAGPREVTELPGGLTNHNFRVRTAEHDVVVRLSSADSELLGVDREHEWLNSRAAAEAGVGAPVLDYLPGHGVLVVQFLPGRTYAAHDVGANLRRIADALRRLHAGPEFASPFDMFDIQRGYRAIVAERRLAAPAGYDELADRVGAVEAALRARPEALVPCHNDLLAANFLDDGGDVRIIDYEYSGMNEPAFELGNLVNESRLDHACLAELVEAYYGTVTAQRLARAELWGLAGQYAWTLWGAIQHAVSDVGADFWSFALERFEPAARLLTSPRLGVLIEDAVGVEGPA
ncbi:choline kinase [Intrasporangium oryzae NRRL B-24470]|uniref:Choline kinase n=1 Tax=Intrasporangium oryzae NRRL B-24470 TaxID=1386089 RepID=W9G614_9MICO|nr:choline/ethanolamine kinase family protein [Intrasporangium oryzae]EWT00752.1 choline kinase [Intrasporangium oryzae NRRL B-24470]